MMNFNILRFLKTASAVVAVAAMLQAPTAFGQLNIIWTGATDTDWNTASNWNAGVPGSLDTAFIIDGAATPATVSTLVPTVTGVHVGQGGTLAADFNSSGNVDGTDLPIWESAFGLNANGDADNDTDSDGRDFLSWQRQFGQIANGDGQLDIIAGGDLTTTNFISLGSDSGRNGTLNVSGGSLTAVNIFSGNSGDVNPSLGTANFSGGTVSASGTIFVGAGTNTAGSSVTQSGTALVTTDGLNVGEASTASYSLSGGTLNVTNPDGFGGVRIGNGAQGTFTHSGGTLTTSGAHFAVGVFAQGTYAMPVGSTGVVNINGGGQLLVGNEDPGAGSLFDQDGGTVNSTTLTIVGRGSAVPATYDISGGALNTPTLHIGTSTASSGSSFIQSGGTVTLTSNMDIGVGGGGLGGAGSYSMSGGLLDAGNLIQVGGGADAAGSSLSVSGGTLNVVDINPGAFAQGTMSVSGTADVNMSGNMQISAAAGSSGSSLAVSGGTLDANSIFVGVSGGVGSVDLSGGTITTVGAMRVAENAASGGSFVAHSNGVLDGGGLVVGFRSSGTYTQTGGSILSDRIDLGGDIGAPGVFGTGVFNMSAGTVNTTGGTVVDSIAPEPGGSGTMNLSGTASYTSESISVGDNLTTFDGTLTGKTAGGTGVLSITGSSVDLSLGGVWIGDTGTLEVVADASGISTIVTTGGAHALGGGTFLIGDLDIDLSALASNADLTLIDNTDNVDASVLGTFAGLAEGATFMDSSGTKNVTITYVGGVGSNDVLLTNITDIPALAGAAVPEPASAMMLLVGLAGLASARRRRSDVA